MLGNYIKFTTLFTFLFWSKCFGAEEGMPQLNPEYWISQIFWLTLIFSFLYLILWKKILPKITENLENRKLQILNDLDSAQKFKDESEKKLMEYKKILEKANQESRKIVNEAIKKINNDIENKKKQLDLDINKEIENAENEIKKTKLSSINDINKIAVDTSSEIIKEIIGNDANKSSVTAIVKDVSKKELAKHL